MATVNFLCAFCNQMIAVGRDHLGQHVECPHCQQVIQVPADAPPADDIPAAAVLSPPAVEEKEDLAHESLADHGDDIFGSPTVVIPPVPELTSQGPPPDPVPPLSLELPPHIHEPAPAPLDFAADRTSEAASHATDAAVMAAHSLDTTTAPTDAMSELPRPTVRAPAARGGSLGALLLIFLIPYAVVSSGTIVYLIYLVNQERNRPAPFDPLELLRDPEKAGPKQRVAHDEPLPYKLTTQLNKALTVGEVEVKPLAIRHKEGRLLLTLQLRNTSTASAFNPLSPVFVEFGGPGSKKPYTFLQVGDDIAYGGTLSLEKEPPRPAGKLFDGVLKPGESCVLVLETLEPFRKVVDRAVRYPEPMLWRVQVRRGFVEVNSQEVPATAVVGVEFRKKDIEEE